ncbi:Hypothetical protein PHPALM_36249 [Phytophthora palmivora]|uniref:Uncharacterized protein n=1 Tax=Phytophthora palmivora TaxID=4796 RepID=A0A2P4X0F2_9STRA|nr:Hypothetical protein PHPALM_36249 [Phytophthora palmivora]
MGVEENAHQEVKDANIAAISVMSRRWIESACVSSTKAYLKVIRQDGVGTIISAVGDEAIADHAQTLNVHLMPVPPGLTPVCQPADISWFRPLKQKLPKAWIATLSVQLKPTTR